MFPFQDFSYLANTAYRLLGLLLDSASLFAKKWPYTIEQLLRVLHFAFIKRKLMSATVILASAKRVAALLLHISDTSLVVALLYFLRLMKHKYHTKVSSLLEPGSESQRVFEHHDP